MSADRVTSQIGPWGQVPRWVLGRLSGDCTAIAVYAALATWADHGNDCFPHQATIADLLGITPDTVSRVVQRLSDQGLVTVSARLVKGRKIGNDYRLVQLEPGTAPGADSGVTEPRPRAVPQTAPPRGSLDQTKEQTTSRSTTPSSRKPRARNPVWDALATACGFPLETSALTSGARGMLKRATADLTKLGATGDEVERRAAEYRRRHPAWDLTPTALAKWWSTLGDDTDDGPLDLTALQERMNADYHAREAMTPEEREAECMKDPRYAALFGEEG